MRYEFDRTDQIDDLHSCLKLQLVFRALEFLVSNKKN